ncbi:hypothetical protein BC938DRAFT_477246 [Jimgerdemannia flammicorona]|uniref:Six-hairpin glycosidase-like protein n=1 Tax=Jimgerdemannia flammicorona TaxID=994334 RepID=A0A433QPK3_9FUNG|nr:hypothetical protein BC938DRAFT_477246 [Jimgerdemannia flammicorona]
MFLLFPLLLLLLFTPLPLNADCPPPPPLAPRATKLRIESLTGKVTATELANFAGFVRQLTLPKTALENVIADGFSGRNIQAMGMVYELSRDPQLLDTMIANADAMLKLRNDPNKGRVMWTGKRDLVWITEPERDIHAGYAGAENGDTIGHIAYTAKLILENPCLLNRTVTIGNKYGFGKTYYDRAHTYIYELERTMDTYIIPWFINNNTLTEIYPKNVRFPTTDIDTHFGGPLPWNQMMMLNNGLQRLAEAHELLGDNPEKVSYYDSLVNRSIHYMTDHFLKRTSRGHDTYLILYLAEQRFRPKGSSVSTHGELTEIHLLYDVWGLIRGYHRANNKYGISKDLLTRVANTISYSLVHRDGKFGAYCDGTGSVHHLPGPYLLYSEFNSDGYLSLAKVMAKHQALDVASVLYMKSRLHLQH